MTLEDARLKLGEALADPRRRQFAHIAILDIAMAVRQALETRGLSGSAADEATEATSAYLKGELDDLSDVAAERGMVVEAVTIVVSKISQEPSFASIFR